MYVDASREVLVAGSSRPWPDILQSMRGNPNMTVQPMLNYFQPLIDYLDTYINETGLHVGWHEASGNVTVEHAQDYLQDYNADLERRLNEYMEADWEAATNITEENTNAAVS